MEGGGGVEGEGGGGKAALGEAQVEDGRGVGGRGDEQGVGGDRVKLVADAAGHVDELGFGFGGLIGVFALLGEVGVGCWVVPALREGLEGNDGVWGVGGCTCLRNSTSFLYTGICFARYSAMATVSHVSIPVPRSPTSHFFRAALRTILDEQLAVDGAKGDLFGLAFGFLQGLPPALHSPSCHTLPLGQMQQCSASVEPGQSLSRKHSTASRLWMSSGLEQKVNVMSSFQQISACSSESLC